MSPFSFGEIMQKRSKESQAVYDAGEDAFYCGFHATDNPYSRRYCEKSGGTPDDVKALAWSNGWHHAQKIEGQPAIKE